VPQKRTIIWTILAVAFLGGVVYFSVLRKPKTEYLTTEAKKSNLSQTVSVSGTLKANDTLALDFEANGRVRTVDVKVGQKVAKGDVVGSLDGSSLQLAADQARANLEKAEAEAGINRDTTRSAEVAVENAEKYLDDTKRLNNKNIDAAEQKVSDTKNYLDDAQSYYNAIKDENGPDSSATKSAKLTLDTAESNWEQAKKSLDVADQTADLSKTSAENTLASSKATLAAAESQYLAAAKDANVASFEAAYQAALVNLDDTILRAPANGTIKEVNYRVGEVIGAAVANSFAKMISYDFIMEAKVPESDIAKVKAGQKAVTTFDAFEADEKFSAALVSIDPSATVVQDVVDYIVKFSMDRDDARFRDGMSADLDILVAEKNNVLVIPERAVKETDGKKTVQILENKKPVNREVKTGMKGDGGMVEIVSGLNEGEQVVTSTK